MPVFETKPTSWDYWFNKDELHLKPTKIKHYLKIINTYLKKNIFILKQIICCEKIRNDIRILVGQVVLRLLIKTCKIVFWSIIQKPLGLLQKYWIAIF